MPRKPMRIAPLLLASYALVATAGDPCPHVLTQYDILADKLKEMATQTDASRIQELVELIIEYGEQTRQICSD